MHICSNNFDNISARSEIELHYNSTTFGSFIKMTSLLCYTCQLDTTVYYLLYVYDYIGNFVISVYPLQVFVELQVRRVALELLPICFEIKIKVYKKYCNSRTNRK